jgi:hypothetical protein
LAVYKHHLTFLLFSGVVLVMGTNICAPGSRVAAGLAAPVSTAGPGWRGRPVAWPLPAAGKGGCDVAA